MNIVRKKIYFLITGILIIFAFLSTEQTSASKELKKNHEEKMKEKIKCDFCHHEIDIKMEKKVSDEIKKKDAKWKKSKKCSVCHEQGNEEIKEYLKLKDEIKLLHKKCRDCHMKPENKKHYDTILKNTAKYLKKEKDKESRCFTCHKK